MRLFRLFAILFAALLLAGQPAHAQADDRNATREKVRQLLATAGPAPDVNMAFRPSAKAPYNFVASMTTGLKNSDSLEVVVSVTTSGTLDFRVYPHYKHGYINLGKARDASGLMRKLLNLSDDNFLFWGADASSDVFSGYTITLESGFPSEAIVVVLRSIKNADKFVGEMRPFIDGSSAS